MPISAYCHTFYTTIECEAPQAPLNTVIFPTQSTFQINFCFLRNTVGNQQSPHLLTFMGTRNRFREIDSTSLCSLAGQYDIKGCRTGPPGWESIPGLLKRSTNTGSGLVYCILVNQEEARVLQQPCLLSAIKFSNVHFVKVHKKDILLKYKIGTIRLL